MKKSIVLASILAGLDSLTGYSERKPSHNSKSKFRIKPAGSDQRNGSKSQRVMRQKYGWNTFAIGARRIDRKLMKQHRALKVKLERARV